MTQLNPYLTFDGNAEAAFKFYTSVFGGELNGIMRWSDNPDCGEFSEADKNRVMHTALRVGDSVLMGSDSISGFGQKFVAGNNFTIAITPESREHADRLYAALSEGGNAPMPMQDAFWGGYFGSLTDKFGIQWMINYDAMQS
jgi:PhnB protein